MSLDYGETPRYLQLAQALRAQIESGEIPPHAPIPSKKMIKDMYGVAGSTCDRAIQILKDEGRLVTVPGLGLYVTERKDWHS